MSVCEDLSDLWRECVCVREKDKGFESGDGSLVTGFGFPAIVTGRL